MKRIGLLGGSFNPAHSGHRNLSRFVLRALQLDEVWWLVSPGNPLKDRSDMAPLEARFASADAMARRLPVRVTVIERQLSTLYTVDTLRALRRRMVGHRFIWLMGADNLAQFHRWRDWRTIARLVPIAVMLRPGYDAQAHTARAMGWLRRFVRPAGQASNWAKWRLPALVLLKMPPDPTSATALRAADPHWHKTSHKEFNYHGLRDRVTRRLLG
jgi:nicotinate-nucleotide adenylyltransferase